ncbi:MAG: hypothetical protein K2Y56_19050 [Methylobacterium sp.]|uniref:DUF6894 family protein n=1 Tax=Methylobacterium sp. TaxID=409 RepID=UPI0025E4C0B4|nr:hypothetical protein [Methylobacterium sp.]MBX9933589.1 hypothetical protein [Methylobacterium sp.]
MPRYFFHVFDGKSTLDADGTELPDWHTARREAVRLAGEILSDEAQGPFLGNEWRMEVTDAKGLTLFQLDFFFTESAAIQRTMFEPI